MKVNSISSLNFGLKIGAIPNASNLLKKEIPVSKLKLKGYNALIGADVYTPQNRIVKEDLLFKDNKLVAINDFDTEKVNGLINYTVLTGMTVTPGILDEHIHGGYGVSFHNSGEAEIRNLLKKLRKEGTAGVVATTLPGRAEDIKNQIKILNNIIKNPDENAAVVHGIHLEGPFLNPQKRGIHPIESIMKPTVENYESFEPENVKIVTLAPELDEGYKLSHYLRERGINVSAGHSVATAKQVLDSGANQVTHLFNAMAGFHHRIPTIANEGLLNPKITAEMNTDTSLLIPSTMTLIMKQKPKNKLVFISDALPNAGIKKDFVMNDVLIRVNKDWEAKDDNGVLAGSMQFLHNVVKKLIDKTNVSFANFIRYASINPAENIGVKKFYQFKKGLIPNFTIWDNKTYKPVKTFTNKGE